MESCFPKNSHKMHQTVDFDKGFLVGLMCLLFLLQKGELRGA